jgi:hypothetical protein
LLRVSLTEPCSVDTGSKPADDGRIWAKREEQIRGVIDSTAGMYGDLHDITGKGLNEVERIEIAMLLAG